jgi:hypothetical protein
MYVQARTPHNPVHLGLCLSEFLAPQTFNCPVDAMEVALVNSKATTMQHNYYPTSTIKARLQPHGLSITILISTLTSQFRIQAVQSSKVKSPIPLGTLLSLHFQHPFQEKPTYLKEITEWHVNI